MMKVKVKKKIRKIKNRQNKKANLEIKVKIKDILKVIVKAKVQVMNISEIKIKRCLIIQGEKKEKANGKNINFL